MWAAEGRLGEAEASGRSGTTGRGEGELSMGSGELESGTETYLGMLKPGDEVLGLLSADEQARRPVGGRGRLLTGEGARRGGRGG